MIKNNKTKEKNMKENKTTQDYIADGLMAYKKLAKHSLKSKWKKMNLRERCAAARSLVVMDIVAKEPDCFSRKKSEAAWRMRAKEWAKDHDFKQEDAWNAFYFVDSPREIVWRQSTAAMTYPLVQQYYRFLGFVQDYEYSKDWIKGHYTDQIKRDAERVCDRVDVIESKPIARMFKEFIRNFYNVR
jgi:hypothetical protein